MFKVGEDFLTMIGIAVISINCQFLRRDTNDIYFAKRKKLCRIVFRILIWYETT